MHFVSCNPNTPSSILHIRLYVLVYFIHGIFCFHYLSFSRIYVTNRKWEKCNKRFSCTYAIHFSKWLLEFSHFNVAEPFFFNIHSLMFTRLLNVKWYSFWIMRTSVLDYISFAWVDHIFLVMDYYTFSKILILEWPVDSPHKGTLTRKMFPFDNVIMKPKPLHI